jgi:hypothetical protein
MERGDDPVKVRRARSVDDDDRVGFVEALLDGARTAVSVFAMDPKIADPCVNVLSAGFTVGIRDGGS